MQSKITASLSSFKLIDFSISTESSFSQNEGMRYTLENTIEVGEALPKKADLPIIHSVKLNIKISGVSKANPDNKVFNCTGTYLATFKLPKEAGKRESTKLKNDDSFVDYLVAQTVPLAMTHIKSQMQIMELDARNVPIGVPN